MIVYCVSRKPSGSTKIQNQAPDVGSSRLPQLGMFWNVVASDEFESLFPKFQPSRVTITTIDGKSFATRVDVPKGDPRDPMTAEEIGVKFHALGDGVIGKAACDKLAAGILSMDKVGDVREFMKLTVK